ncbi:MAG: aldo/keto reductase, partial [Acidimicrobiales bacterium]
MDMRTIGATGIKVSPICLGSMMFGPWGNTDRDECIRMVRGALDGGINFIDTADVYGGGESEKIVGEALAEAGPGRRDCVVLATKFHSPMGDDPNRSGSSRRWIMRACEESLRRLQTDWIDLYQAHRPDPTCDVEETLSALSDLIHQGKVRAIGSSTFPPEQIVEAQWVAERRGHERFRCEQPPYSILVRAVEASVLPTCQRYGMGAIAWAPLARGWLTGKYRRGQEPPPGSRMTRGRAPESFTLDRPENQAKLDAVEELLKVASDAGMPMAHLAVAFVLSHPAITAAIVGARTPEQLGDLVVMAAEDLRLDDSILDRIDEIAPPGRNVNPADGGYTSQAVADAS